MKSFAVGVILVLLVCAFMLLVHYLAQAADEVPRGSKAYRVLSALILLCVVAAFAFSCH